jgi:hypothetical protein
MWLRWVLAVQIVAGCGSESALFGGAQPQEPSETTPGGDEVFGDATLVGQVCATDGQSAVTNAKVTVLHDPEPSSTTTDNQGEFRLDGLPEGTWEVRIEKGSFQVSQEVTLVDGEVTNLDLADGDCVPLEQGETKIAVVTGSYDAIQDLLDQLHLDYDKIPGITGTAYVDFLRDPAALKKYDIIFFNCGIGNGWIPHEAEVGANLREYVANGGSIYASDWAYWLVESGWPQEHDFHGAENGPTSALVGVAQELNADVLDPGLVTALGSDVAHLNYDLDSWAAMEGATAEVLIRGNYSYYEGLLNQNRRTGPLATRFEDGDGTALFTTFHNERQTTADMLVLLEEFILSL